MQHEGNPVAVDYKVGGVLVDEAYLEQAKEALAGLLAARQIEQPHVIDLKGASVDALVCLEIRPDVTAEELTAALARLPRASKDRRVAGKNRVVQAVEYTLVEAEPHSAPNSLGPPTPVAERLVWRQDDTTGAGVTVGLLDSAIYPNPWLAGSYLVSPPAAWMPDTSPVRATHCTAIAGLMLQQAPAATLHVRPILDEHLTSDSCQVAEAVSRLAGQVDIINMSFGCYAHDDEPPFALEMAMESLKGTGTIAVAAAGNGGDQPGLADRPLWPAALSKKFGDFLVSVGALGAGDEPAPFSSLNSVSLWAPGTDVLAPFIDYAGWVGVNFYRYDGWVRWSGSSLAAATVTGAIAAELSDQRRKNPRATARDALAAVLRNARQVDGRKLLA